MLRSRKVAFFSFISLVLLAAFAFYFAAVSRGKGLLTISFLDVGQGDAIYIEAPNGAQIVIDGGIANGKLLSELGALMPYFDRTIDAIVVTNPDADHYAGFLGLLPRYRVGLLLEPGARADSATYASFEEKIEKENVPKTIARRGMKVMLDREAGVYLSILFPDRDVSNWLANDASIVAKLVYGSTTVMLQGDATEKIEKYLLTLGAENLDADILKVGHHGSKTSTAPEYVGAVSPDFAVISNGKDNRYGHPHKETLDTLAKSNVPALRTDIEGRITFVSDGKKFVRKK